MRRGCSRKPSGRGAIRFPHQILLDIERDWEIEIVYFIVGGVEEEMEGTWMCLVVVKREWTVSGVAAAGVNSGEEGAG